MGNDGFVFTSIFNTVFFVIILLILICIIFAITNGIKQWNYNNSQPILTVPARIVTKRTKVSGVSDDTSTKYYVTFEVESGSRLEFVVKGHEYGLSAEGDVGKLTFQGTRYLGFERNV
ncbi:MAG TPA: DUF2500 domain-containing protein [Clostridia bacterium]